MGVQEEEAYNELHWAHLGPIIQPSNGLYPKLAHSKKNPYDLLLQFIFG